MVVNSKIVGNADILSTSLVKIALNNIIIATDMFKESNKSNSIEFIGIIKKMIADNKNNPTIKSFLFITKPPS